MSKLFVCLFREVVQNFCATPRFQPDTIDSLETTSEDIFVKIFEDTQLYTKHAKPDTVCTKDIQRVRNIGSRKTNNSNPIDLK